MNATPRSPLDQARGFLAWLYEDERGYAEIVAGVPFADRPEKIDLCMYTRRWCYLDPERPDLYEAAAAYICELASAYGNVYIGARLYEKRAKDENRRCEEHTRPSKVIFIDDAPEQPALRYTASIRTSESSRHAYYKCDRNVTKDDARRAAAALGGDPSGVDLTQLVRVPGTFNTKHNGQWLVHSEQSSGPIYPLDLIRATFPQVEPERGKGVIEPIAWPEVERHVSNIDALKQSSRFQLIKPETQTGRILSGEMLTFIVQGKPDDSRSMNASAVATGMLLRGFPDDEISAVVFDLYRQWGVETQKGTAWCKLDIGRILAYIHAKNPGVKQSPTRYRTNTTAQSIADILPMSRARADRPQRFTPAALFARYQDQPDLCALKRRARAGRLEISTATLDRLEDSLERLGLITIDQPKRGLPGKVILLGGVINIDAPEVLSGAQNASAEKAPFCHAASEQTAIDAPQCIGETHPPPEAPRPARPASRAELRTWAADALDCYPGRASFGKVYRHMQMLADGRPLDLNAAKDAYAAERQRRSWAQRDAREAEKARKMQRKALARKSQHLSSAAADMHRKGDSRAAIWTRLAGIYAAEERRRDEAEAQRPEHTLVEQRELLDLVDRQRQPAKRQSSAARPKGSTWGGACLPNTTPAAPQAPTIAAQVDQVDQVDQEQPIIEPAEPMPIRDQLPSKPPVYDVGATIARLKVRQRQPALAAGGPIGAD